MKIPKGAEFNLEDESDASVEQAVKATVYITVKTMMLLTQTHHYENWLRVNKAFTTDNDTVSQNLLLKSTLKKS